MKTDRREFLKLILGTGGATAATLVATPGVLHASNGSYTFTGSANSYKTWKFITEWKEDGGFRQVGPVRYKVEKLHKVYRRSHSRTDTYERLHIVLG